MAGRKLHWGVLGCSGIAREQIIPAIQQSRNGEVVAVAGRDLERTRAYAAELGIARAHDGYEALLADRDIDAVYIPLPNASHAEWSVRAAAAGKPVLCEKPLATTLADARRVVAACAAHGVPLMEAFMYRFHPQNERVLCLIEDGEIGQVREVRAHLSVNIMDPPDYGNIRFSPAIGGGTLFDMGCYAINIVRRVMGAEPETASGWWHIDPASGVDTTAAGLLGFTDGRIGTVTCSFRSGAQGAYLVIGTEGVIEVPRAIIPGMGTRAAEGLVIVADQNGNRREEIFAPVDQYRLMAEAFADAVLTGRPVPYPAEDSLRNVAVMEAIVHSAGSGRQVGIAWDSSAC